MSRSRKKRRTSKGKQRPQASTPARDAPTPAADTPRRPHGSPRRRRALILGIGGLVVVAAVVAVVLLRGAPDDGAAVAPGATEPSDLALREEAYAIARRLLQEFPRSPDPAGLMGTVQNQFGNSAEAEHWWWRCLELDPLRVDIYEVLAVAYLRKGEYVKVADVFDRAQSVNVRLPGVYLRYAEALLELGRLDEALAAIEEEMRGPSDLVETYIAMGKIRFQRREYEEAMEAYAEAARRRPKDSRPYYGLATASARLGRRDESREYMATFQRLRAVEDEASTTRRRSADQMRPVAQILCQVMTDAGRVYAAHERYADAERCWRRAAEVDTRDTGSRVQLVNRYRADGRKGMALTVCRELTRIEPDNARYHHVAGITLAEMGQYDEARAELRRAVELDPNDDHIQQAYRQLMQMK